MARQKLGDINGQTKSTWEWYLWICKKYQILNFVLSPQEMFVVGEFCLSSFAFGNMFWKHFIGSIWNKSIKWVLSLTFVHGGPSFLCHSWESKAPSFFHLSGQPALLVAVRHKEGAVKSSQLIFSLTVSVCVGRLNTWSISNKSIKSLLFYICARSPLIY